ncbi:tol-pal system protein YbgF [Marinobacter nanhaiticus D15-8W]|nr:tol-pal system protein YbgF [Marinobacter nanhaiticus D15-8W]
MAAVALSLCGSALAQSTVPAYQNADSEARRQAGGNQANAELYFMIERLQQEVRRLQGEVEEQRHKLEQLSRQSRERYIDLDQRLLDLSRKQAEAPAAPSEAPQEASGSTAQQQQDTREYRQPTEQEQAAYNAILDLIRNDRAYDQAIDRLYSFISEYPEGDLTVNAYYWLGEVYLVKPQLQQAKQAFSIVATRFADHRKAPDALYKLGVAEARMGDNQEARQTLQSVSSKYPDSNAAQLASEYLTKL